MHHGPEFILQGTLFVTVNFIVIIIMLTVIITEIFLVVFSYKENLGRKVDSTSKCAQELLNSAIPDSQLTQNAFRILKRWYK